MLVGRSPTSTASRAAVEVTSNIRSGSSEAASRAHISTSTVCTARVVEVQAGARVFPAQVIGEPVDRLAVRAALQPLQHQHDRHDHRRHRPANIHRQASEHLIRERLKALTVQQLIDRVRHPYGQPTNAHPPGAAKGRAAAGLRQRQTSAGERRSPAPSQAETPTSQPSPDRALPGRLRPGGVMWTWAGPDFS